MSMKDFVTINKLGEGAFGQVFKVKRQTDGKQYAMKKVKITAMKEKQREMAVNQVRILASLSHQYVIGYKDAFYDQSSQCLCVIMQFANGGDILKKIQTLKRSGKYFDQKQLWKALYQMGSGLKSLHDKKILHRDLKCANIFITENGDYKLGDLNVSKVLHHKGFAHTQTGTPYYASPEVWKDQPYDGKSDMWSLGCVIYQMATFQPPFKASDLQGLYRKVVAGIYQKIPPRYSGDLNAIVGMLLKVNPQQRLTSTQLMQNGIMRKRLGVQFTQQVKSEQQLLQTIKFNPYNLKALKDKLPKSNYQQKKSNIQEVKKQEQPVKKLERRNSSAEIKRSDRVLSAGQVRNPVIQSPRYQYKQPGYKPPPIPPSRNNIQRPPMNNIPPKPNRHPNPPLNRVPSRQRIQYQRKRSNSREVSSEKRLYQARPSVPRVVQNNNVNQIYAQYLKLNQKRLSRQKSKQVLQNPSRNRPSSSQKGGRVPSWWG